MAETPPPAPKVRLIDSMPRPLLVVFVIAGLVAVGAVLVVIINPPIFATVPVEERRPPPKGTLSHDVGRLAPLPVPSVLPAFTPPCPSFARVHLRAGPAGVVRLRAALKDVCAFTAGGVASEVSTAVRGLEHATIGFASFRRAGVESTTDVPSATIWLNGKFARTDLPVEQLVPVLLHEGYHLARATEAVDAREELAARSAEVSSCRLLIPIKKWPRWCEDARTLTDLPEARAVQLLVSAGYKP